jgi:lauroyl/myristoyl acyltransferase
MQLVRFVADLEILLVPVVQVQLKHGVETLSRQNAQVLIVLKHILQWEITIITKIQVPLI